MIPPTKVNRTKAAVKHRRCSHGKAVASDCKSQQSEKASQSGRFLLLFTEKIINILYKNHKIRTFVH